MSAPCRNTRGTFAPYYPYEKWHEAVAWVNKQNDTDPVFVDSRLVEATWLHASDDPLLRSYLSAPANSLYQVAGPQERLRPLGRSPDRFDDDDLAVLRRSGRAWVLTRSDPGEDPSTWKQGVARELRAKGLSCDVQVKLLGIVWVARLTLE